jgi:hypothetical protein
MEYRAKTWSDKIFTETLSKVWEGMLDDGVCHSWKNGLPNQEKVRIQRIEKKVLTHIRLTFVVFNGWAPSRVSSRGWVRGGTLGWKMSGRKWLRIKGRGHFEAKWEKVWSKAVG